MGWTKREEKRSVFRLEKKAHKVRAKVVATIGAVAHDFVLPNHDVCKQLGCPLKNDVQYAYQNSMLIGATYPSVGLPDCFFLLLRFSSVWR